MYFLLDLRGKSVISFCHHTVILVVVLGNLRLDDVIVRVEITYCDDKCHKNGAKK